VSVAITRHFYGVAKAKCFVNVHLHCIVSNLKRRSKMSILTHPGKIFGDANAVAYCTVILVLVCFAIDHLTKVTLSLFAAQ